MSAFTATATPINTTTSWSYMSPDVVSQRLEYMVGASVEVCGHSAHLTQVMSCRRHASNRAHAIKWIKEVVSMSDMSMDARDTSVQIFDRYFGRHLQEDPSAFDNSATFSSVAAVAVLLSSKFHESRPLSMSSFGSFTTEALSMAENKVLVALDYDIVPLATPTSFIHHMLLLWPNLEADAIFLSNVTDVASRMVGDFWESAASCRYAPSTIALAALLLAFASMHVDCSHWLMDRVPSACLPGDDNNIFPKSDFCLLDIEGCLSELQTRCCSRKIVSADPTDGEADEPRRFDSPVSVLDGFRATTPVAEAAALSLSDDKASPAHAPRAVVPSHDRPAKSKRIKLF